MAEDCRHHVIDAKIAARRFFFWLLRCCRPSLLTIAASLSVASLPQRVRALELSPPIVVLESPPAPDSDPESDRLLIGTAMVCTLLMFAMDSAAYIIAVDIKELKYSDRDDTPRPRNDSDVDDTVQELPSWSEMESSLTLDDAGLSPESPAPSVGPASKSTGARWRNVSVRQQEQLPLTAAVLWGSVIAAGDSEALVVLLPVYVALRLLYVVAYVRAWQPWRSIAWILSQLVVVASSFVGLLAALGSDGP